MPLSLVQDASDPQGVALQPGVLVTAGYIGGDTPHVWTAADWAVWGTRWRVPIWVRSDPGQVDATADANACVAALQAQGAPPPYLVLPYGSTGNIFTEPAEDGYWPAFPGPAALYGHAGVVATQYQLGSQYDLSVIDQSVPTWDTLNGTGPTAVMLDLETAGFVDAPGYVSAFAAILHGVAPSGSVVVPDVVGLGGNDAASALQAVGLGAHISTNSPVSSQTPGPGAIVPQGAVVDLGI